MAVGQTYYFDHSKTDYCTLFLEGGDKVAFLAEPVFPPVGTNVILSDGRESVVESVDLDLSDRGGLAQVYVRVRVTGRGFPISPELG